MSTEDNKELVRRYRQAHNTNQLDLLDEIVTADLISHNLLPGFAPGLESGKIAHRRALAACPDYQVETVDLIAEEDKVVERWRASGTHTGTPFFGVPASGKPFSGTGISIYRIAHGKIVEHWAEADFLGLLQQLGALPAGGEQEG
jgi:predicted ester cyclase